jgi:uncharacterized protein (TIGR00290 family)
MKKMKKKLLSWSSGKDASYTLLSLKEQNNLPDLLVTNINKNKERVSMHGVRTSLLQQQASRLGIPLYVIELDETINMQDYTNITHKHFLKLANQSFDTVYFGDIFLEDLKQFRIKEMNKIGMKACFPIWGKDTKQLAFDIIDSGIKAVVTAVSSHKLHKNFVGREFNEDFLNDLPEDVDWCGENGEFHTFVYDHPLFTSPIAIKKGEIVFKSFKPCTQKDKSDFNINKDEKINWDTGFWYMDILPK